MNKELTFALPSSYALPMEQDYSRDPLAPLIKKPVLRGYFHQEAFFTAVGACALLIAKSSSPIPLLASIVYSVGLLTLFGVSAIYHRPHWEPHPRALWKRADHSAIFIFIAGSFTPICLLALPAAEGNHLLAVIWGTALFGILQSIFWVRAPKWVTAIFYVAAGWLVIPYAGQLQDSLGEKNLALIFAGGLVYTLGAIFYAMKKPKLNPAVFGYHELFHALTVVAAILHFIVIYQLIR